MKTPWEPNAASQPQRLRTQAVFHVHLHEPIDQDGTHLPVDVMLGVLENRHTNMLRTKTAWNVLFFLPMGGILR